MACKQVQNFIPPRSFDFQDFYQSRKTGKIFSKKCISGTKSKINKSLCCCNIQHVNKYNANKSEIFKHNDWHCRLSFFFTLALVERRNPSISNYIRDVINYLKKGFFLRAGYLLRQIPRYTEFPSTNTPTMSIKRKKTKNW